MKEQIGNEIQVFLDIHSRQFSSSSNKITEAQPSCWRACAPPPEKISFESPLLLFAPRQRPDLRQLRCKFFSINTKSVTLTRWIVFFVAIYQLIEITSTCPNPFYIKKVIFRHLSLPKSIPYLKRSILESLYGQCYSGRLEEKNWTHMPWTGVDLISLLVCDSSHSFAGPLHGEEAVGKIKG